MGKKSQSTTTTYGNTTTKNPYATATTNNSGTTASLNAGTALDSVYNFVNKNINSLLDEYLNPNLNSTTNQAKLNQFTTTLGAEASKNLENNIISPLSERNMIRSSQATDLYNNLSDTATNSLASYVNELLAASQDNTASMINNLLAAYMQGYDVISDMQQQSLQTSAGNATTTSSGGSAFGSNFSSGVSSASSLVSILGNLAKILANKSA